MKIHSSHVNKIGLLLIISLSTALCSSCWNYREIEELGIVSACAIDKIDGEFKVTAELLNAQTIGNNSTINTAIIEGQGITIFEAIRNLIPKLGRKLYWSHAKVFIISEEVAKENIVPLVDWIFRGAEVRTDMNIILAKGFKAEELLKLKPDIEYSVGLQIEHIMKTNQDVSRIPFIDLWDFMTDMQEEGISAAVPTAQIKINNGKPIIEIVGTAFFEREKLHGYLNGAETRYYSMIRNKINGGVLVLESYKPQNDVSLEIYDAVTKVKPEISEAGISMGIDSKIEVTLVEVSSNQIPLNQSEIEKIQKAAEQKIKSNMENLIVKMQTEYNADIFGFGEKIKKTNPKVWKEIRGSWKELFPEIIPNINVSVIIRNTSTSTNAVRISD